ncbi:MAG: isocitrate/isopropylmalate dehydrogenase family protein [Armatimonadetes bacterium]|nr:isocitrate/isopropylmalate dehydrogenase family protein [Armatimonadota bacterium]
MGRYRIAVLAGDGIGPEVIREGVRVLTAAVQDARDTELVLEELPAGAGEYRKGGKPLPDHTLARCREADAVFLGAMGLPDVRWPDGTEMVPQIELRFVLDLYAGIRPIRWYPGVPAVLAQKRPADVDFVVVRESTEGLFASLGGGVVLRNEVATDQQVITRKGTERVCRAAFRWARRRAATRGRAGRVTCVDKANVFRSMAFFRQVFYEVAAEFPDVAAGHEYVDACAMKLVRQPEQFDVLVTENMFGDILSDLGPGLIGGLGLAPSADLGDTAAVFQPTHGTAPDIAGQGLANPLATILSGAMLLDWLGDRRHDPELRAAGAKIEQAVEQGLQSGDLRGPDLGGSLTTEQIGERVATAVLAK